MSGNGAPLHLCTCEVHGKLSFESRKLARLHARRVHPGDHRLNAYECDATPGLWHLGHLPRVVVRGRIDRTRIGDRRR
jgi:hypothetical protein